MLTRIHLAYSLFPEFLQAPNPNKMQQYAPQMNLSELRPWQ